jgi:hypothetical protein
LWVRLVFLFPVGTDDAAFRLGLDALRRVCAQEANFLESPVLDQAFATALQLAPMTGWGLGIALSQKLGSS